MNKRLFAVAIATWGGVGLVPWCPGTVASAVTVAMWWFLPEVSLSMQFVIVGMLSVVGIRTATIAEQYFGIHDPSAAVIDEVVGMSIALVGCPRIWWVYLVAFALFRLFDIVKPGPIYKLQDLPRGWGIVMDDVAAGVAARLVLMPILYMLV